MPNRASFFLICPTVHPSKVDLICCREGIKEWSRTSHIGLWERLGVCEPEREDVRTKRRYKTKARQLFNKLIDTEFCNILHIVCYFKQNGFTFYTKQNVGWFLGFHGLFGYVGSLAIDVHNRPHQTDKPNCIVNKRQEKSLIFTIQ